VWLGDGRSIGDSRPLEDVERAVVRVRQLFETVPEDSENRQDASGATRSNTSNASCRT
jgi:hypothetical protein